jgi:hypothetical protein
LLFFFWLISYGQHNGRAQLHNETLKTQLEDLQARLKDMCFEAQLSIPDVIVWLLSGDKRRAFLRIPVVDIFSAEGLGCGPQCGIATASLMGLPRAGPKASKPGDVPAQITWRAWFGPRETQVANSFAVYLFL